MPSKRLADRKVNTYAHTLFEAALSEDRVFENLEPLSADACATPEFMAMIEAMVEQDDLAKLSEVYEAYKAIVEGQRQLAGAHSGVSEEELEEGLRGLNRNTVVGVHVTTAIPLDDELRDIIQAKCEAQFEGEVFLIEHVDPTIIGGIVLSARGHRRDASIKMQLNTARKIMTQEIKKSEV